MRRLNDPAPRLPAGPDARSSSSATEPGGAPDGTSSGGPSPATRIGLAGFAATAIACGPARMGFGLFVPDFRAEFGLGAGAIGTIGSVAFAGALAGLLVVGALTRRHGAMVPVLLGCASAAVGLALVGLSGGVATLTVGLALAAVSSGLCWVPYNRAVERAVRPERRARTLSIVSTGTTFGIVAAGALALGAAMASVSWRPVWLAFAAAALAIGVLNALSLPRPPPGDRSRDPGTGTRDAGGGAHALPLGAKLRRLATRRSLPLHVAAFSFGLLYAVFLSFGVDRVVDATPPGGALAAHAGPWIFVAFGLAGTIGLATDTLARRLGAERLTALSFAAVGIGFVALAFVPERVPIALGAAALFGAATMIVCATLSFRALDAYPGMPALGFNAVIGTLTLGSVAGPIVAGAALELAGPVVAFGGCALLSAILAVALAVGGRTTSPDGTDRALARSCAPDSPSPSPSPSRSPAPRE